MDCSPAISIHAPTWGATSRTRFRSVRRTRYFNPRTHVGCDLFPQILNLCRLGFQSTHPRGVRRLSRKEGKTKEDFNPRTHVGCDDALNQSYRLTVFQSTHPRGVRHMCYNPITITIRISIHAPTWGATLSDQQSWWHCFYFNPRTHVGCDKVEGLKVL